MTIEGVLQVVVAVRPIPLIPFGSLPRPKSVHSGLRNCGAELSRVVIGLDQMCLDNAKGNVTLRMNCGGR